MQINALRRELTALLAAGNPKRTPALRRCSREAWLYATDASLLVQDGEKDVLEKTLTAAGWEFTEEKGWTLLRKNAAEPPEEWYSGAFGPEAACCASLLDRHAGGDFDAAGEVQRMLIKAGEKGEKAYEDACRHLHREWAGRLRRGEPLPAVSRRYFGK